MTKGFALVASPAPYGGSGSMSFIVNQERKRIQKDLRPRTAALASDHHIIRSRPQLGKDRHNETTIAASRRIFVLIAALGLLGLMLWFRRLAILRSARSPFSWLPNRHREIRQPLSSCAVHKIAPVA